MLLTKSEIKIKAMPIFKKYNIKKAYLFGSYVRGEATEDSDIDILFDDNEKMGYFELSGVRLDLVDALDKPVDLVPIGGLKNRKIKETIFREMELIYEG